MGTQKQHKCRCPCLKHRDEIHPGKASDCSICGPIMKRTPDAYTRNHPPENPYRPGIDSP